MTSLSALTRGVSTRDPLTSGTLTHDASTQNVMDMLHMPPEMVAEIYTHLQTLDSVNFAKTCKYIYPHWSASKLKQHALMKKVIHDINLIQYTINQNKSRRFTRTYECKYVHSIFDGYDYDILDVRSTKEINPSRLRPDAPENKYELSHTWSYFKCGQVTLFIVTRSQDGHYYDKYPSSYNFHTRFEFIAGPDSESDNESDSDFDYSSDYDSDFDNDSESDSDFD
jgi:hypothetical protein